MTDLAVLTIFTLILLIIIAIIEKTQKRIDRKKYTDEWFDKNVDYNYLNRKERIRRIMEDMRC